MRNGIRALIVDDEPSICKAMAIALARAGYETVTALSGEAALSIIRAQQIDAMLIDLRIPDMRGDVIFELAAGHHPHLRYRTLFMTGDITERAQKLIGVCRCPVLMKPFDLRVMIDAMNGLSPSVRDQSA